MKQVFVINPIAGKRQFQREIEAVINRVCTEEKADWEIYKTKAVGDAHRFVKTYPGEDTVNFYAIGGDGTLKEVVNGAMDRGKARVGVFPCGSGNDFVRTFTNSRGFLDVAAQLKATIKPIDLIRARGQYAVNMCNMGLDAEAAAGVHRFTPLLPGGAAYYVSLLNRFLHKLGQEMKVTLDNGEVIAGTFILATFANGVAYGGGWHSAPKARLDDGLMDICLIKPMGRLRMTKLLNIYKAGEHLDSGALKDVLIYRRSSRVLLETPVLENFCMDGETTPLKEVEMEIVPGALDFIVPQGVA